MSRKLAVFGVLAVAACTPAPQREATAVAKPEWEPLEMSWEKDGHWFHVYGEQVAWRAIVEAARPQLTSCFESYAASIDRCRALPTKRVTKPRVHFRPWREAPSKPFLDMEGLHPGVELVPDYEDPGCQDELEEAEVAGAFDSCVSHAIGEVLQGAPPDPGVTIIFSNFPPTMGGLGTRP